MRPLKEAQHCHSHVTDNSQRKGQLNPYYLSLVLDLRAPLPGARLMAAVRPGPFGLIESVHLLHTSYCMVNNSFLASKKQREA